MSSLKRRGFELAIYTFLILGSFFLLYFAIAATPTWDQNNFWFRDDDGTQTTATGYGVENTAKNLSITNVPTSTPFRLRFGLLRTTANGSITPRIDYKAGSDCTTGTWTKITTTSTLFRLRLSPNFVDGAATTQQITSGAFTAGKMYESSNPGSLQSFNKNRSTEFEWSLQSSSTLPYNTTYAFRMSDNGIILDAYTVCPTLTTLPAPPAPTAALSANPTAIALGATSTLTWSTTNANQVSINNGIGSVGTTGSTVVSPTTTTIYTLTAIGDGGTTSTSATVTVYQPPTISVSANPPSIILGQSSTLSWNSTNATSITLYPSTTTLAVPSGTLSISPTTTTTYTVVATGPGGTATDTTTVTVTYPPPTITSFTVNPTTIQRGEGATLSWNSTNALTASIDQGIGSVSVSGTQAVSPTATTTYMLTVVGLGGTATSTVTLNVTPPPPPTASISASPTAIALGAQSTLSWSTTNATSISIDQGIGSVGASGSQLVSPTTSTLYTITATGLGGTVTNSVLVTVYQPPVIHSFTATPSTIDYGTSATLTWSSSNGTSASIDQGVGSVPITGSTSVTLTTSTTFTLTVTGLGGTTNATVHVTVNLPPPPTISSFYADPTSIAPGQNSTLHWNTTNATSVTIDNAIGPVAANGSQTVSPAITTTYTLTATGLGGSVTASATVTITVLPPTASLSASPSTIENGESTTLSWSTTNATSTSIDNGVGVVAASGSTSISPALTTTYTLTATGTGGTVTTSTVVTVIPPANIISFVASTTTIESGQSLTLSWDTANAASVSIDNGVGSVAATGSTTVSPAADTTYTLTVSNGRNSHTASITITVTAPATLAPVISSFTISPTSIGEGSSALLSWATTNTVSASIDQGIGAIATNGSLTVSPSITTTYTITVIGSASSTRTATVTLTVTAPPPPGSPPTINFFTVDPLSITAGNSATLRWNVTNASSTSIDQGIGSVANIDTLTVSPTENTTYTITAANPNGTRTESATLSVTAASTPKIVTPEETGKPATQIVKPSTANFSGKASPGAQVSLYEKVYDQDILIQQGIAVSDNGQFMLWGIPTGFHSYAIAAKDRDGRPTGTKVFNQQYINGSFAAKDILLSPTVDTSQGFVSQTDNLTVLGMAFPYNQISIEIDKTKKYTATADNGGSYSISIPMAGMSLGDHTVRAQQIDNELKQTSDYSPIKNFSITANPNVRTDLNNDGITNIQDWSIFLQLWSKNDASSKKLLDLNGDGKVDITDLSIFLKTFRK